MRAAQPTREGAGGVAGGHSVTTRLTVADGMCVIGVLYGPAARIRNGLATGNIKAERNLERGESLPGIP